ncbi:tRNA-dihydrouridine synthase [Azoarcus sp. L1K30]|uniref:tRNA dihydrouridine synthase n=1 Tax=Azoarcus sp. L1K30 TaxID=2820277 RepID=UPI001B83E2B3|nr:tRNA-dihydrouridine synthase [Azoarcus sp. L1K30]MBR0564617.1 tRNA-dihydrouridine synthase [Azoarcus sp. L1K30]
MRLLLAPMEGLLDDVLRAVLSRIGGYDCAVSEFARVSGSVLPHRCFRRIVPELDHGSRAVGGMPVRVQLLGSDPAAMAENAAQLAMLAPAAVDLNFGCPAPTVNRHRGGAILLDEPELLHRIAHAVRSALPGDMLLTAKMRLGVADKGRALECAQALAGGGASEIVVHARTKLEGYRPPAHWEWVGRIADVVSVPVVANGEVWTVEDWQRCRAVSGAADVMLGRGAVTDPFLARRIRDGQGDDEAVRAAEWSRLEPLIAEFRDRVVAKVAAHHAPGRIKQWLNMLRRRYVEAEALYQSIRPLKTLTEIDRVLLALRILPEPVRLAA